MKGKTAGSLGGGPALGLKKHLLVIKRRELEKKPKSRRDMTRKMRGGKGAIVVTLKPSGPIGVIGLKQS